MKKRVILYATKFMDIYKDILKYLYEMNFDVIWIEANTIPHNPYNKTFGLYTPENLQTYMSKAKEKWHWLLEQDIFMRPIDYFISVVGIDIHPFVFEELNRINPNIRKVLYMHDRIEGVYQIDEFLQYYDEVFSFDIGDSKQFNLSFLPIYWVPSNNKDLDNLYDIFGFASFSPNKPNRTKLFKELKAFANNTHLSEFIKLYDKSYAQNRFMYIFKVLLKSLLRKDPLTVDNVLNGLITENSVSPDIYRKLISSSKVIFDTQADYQDGLTARFMWALGAGKKIITTNANATKYDFYNEKQILVIKDSIYSSISTIEEFVKTPFLPDSSLMKKIEPFRIENWIKRLLAL